MPTGVVNKLRAEIRVGLGLVSVVPLGPGLVLRRGKPEDEDEKPKKNGAGKGEGSAKPAKKTRAKD